jgi:hypothetical protein
MPDDAAVIAHNLRVRATLDAALDRAEKAEAEVIELREAVRWGVQFRRTFLAADHDMGDCDSGRIFDTLALAVQKQ